jgi:hypothetical protein
MREFSIKDMVRLKEDDKVLFMVVDYADFTQPATNGKPIIDIDYELMQIYPISKNSKYSTVGQNDLEIKEPYGTRNYQLLMSFIQKDREKKGWYGTPDFIEIAESNLKSIANAEVRTVGENKKMEDVIRYDLIDTVDKCLDALNDLTALHKSFGDEAYLTIREVVKERLEKLTK